MNLPIEKRLKLIGDVSNLMLMGSIHVYGTKSSRVTLPKIKMKKVKAA